MMPLEKQACGRFFMEKDAEKPLPEEEERVYKKRRVSIPDTQSLLTLNLIP
ncbi:MAG TPA: hypothetical protein K8W07_12130 [Bacteroides togonis]|nr:hypothetical protein [Bacteroides togonis]